MCKYKTLSFLDIRKEKVRIEKLQSLYSVEYIDTYLREVNKMPKWLVPADDKELKRKTNRQSHEFSQIDESFKSDKTFLSADRIRNLKMMVLNAELLDSSKIDVNKIKQAGLNLERFCDKMDFNTKVICEDLDEEVKDFASKCSCSSKVLYFWNSSL